jgi:potassium-transporting ATPase KdpC subunit
MTSLISSLRASLVMLVLMTGLLGVAYPALTTAILQTAAPGTANGSLLADGSGRIIGSALIGQTFTDPRHLWGRPSATATPYDGANSSGSNLGVNNPALVEAVKARIAALKTADPDNQKPIPVDLVTASASGLDPEISLAAALYQAPRIAKARGMAEKDVIATIEATSSGRALGILGEPRVNVLAVNLTLDGRQK